MSIWQLGKVEASKQAAVTTLSLLGSLYGIFLTRGVEYLLLDKDSSELGFATPSQNVWLSYPNPFLMTSLFLSDFSAGLNFRQVCCSHSCIANCMIALSLPARKGHIEVCVWAYSMTHSGKLNIQYPGFCTTPDRKSDDTYIDI